MTLLPIPPAWQELLAPAIAQPDMARLGAFLHDREQAGAVIYPPRAERLAALDLTAPEAVRVVILGQDPYHGPGQAHGLAFSVRDGVKIPPSLANIFKELHADLGLARPASGDLSAWARQGVLLLNTVLTVEVGQAGSHQGRGWEAFTDAVVTAIAAQEKPTVFLLWGNHAQKKAARIAALERGVHLVLKAPHPSPLSAYAGFFGCGHFGKANAFLEAHGRGTIDWQT